MRAKISYRGWPAHFICGDRCIFHLNTLIELGETRVVVSTVGLMKNWHAPDAMQRTTFEKIGHDRYFETMAFHAYKNDEFWDADVERQIAFNSPWSYSNLSDEWAANKGHWVVVEEIVSKLESGQKL